MKEYRREAARIRAEIEAGLMEYELLRQDQDRERTMHERIARCGTLADDGTWFLRSLIYAATGRLPDIAFRPPPPGRAVMLH